MTKLLVAAFLLSQLLRGVPAEIECGGKFPSGYVKYVGKNKILKLHNEHLSWDRAREVCRSEGADLAVGVTPRELEYILNTVGHTWIWIGIHRPGGEGGDWVRVDTGQPIPSSAPWDQFTDISRFNCVVSHALGKISDHYCTRQLSFVCEISLAKGCPDPGDTQVSKGDTGSFDLARAEVASLYLMVTLQLLTLAALEAADRNLVKPEPIPHFVLPEGYVAHPNIGAAYKVHLGEFVAWKEAEHRCNLEGTHLAVIDSLSKFQYVWPFDHEFRHVGIHNVDGGWSSMTNATISVSAVMAGEARGGDRDDDDFGDFVCEIPLHAAV